MTPKTVDMIFSADKTGRLAPIRWKLPDGRIFSVDSIKSVSEEKLAGNNMLVYTVTASMDGASVTAKLKYEHQSRRWWLFRLSRKKGDGHDD